MFMTLYITLACGGSVTYCYHVPWASMFCAIVPLNCATMRKVNKAKVCLQHST